MPLAQVQIRSNHFYHDQCRTIFSAASLAGLSLQRRLFPKWVGEKLAVLRRQNAEKLAKESPSKSKDTSQTQDNCTDALPGGGGGGGGGGGCNTDFGMNHSLQVMGRLRLCTS